MADTSDELLEIWFAHEHPDRPLAWGAQLCDCRVCAMVLVWGAVEYPRLELGLKTVDHGRVVTVRLAAEPRKQGWAMADLLRFPGDRVREPWVVRPAAPRRTKSRRVSVRPTLRAVSNDGATGTTPVVP